MPNYHVEYETWNEYQNHVGESFFAFLVLPCSDEKQRLTQYKFVNSIDEPSYVGSNHYGFQQITFRTLKPFNKLRIHLTCDVHVSRINPFEFKPLEVEQEKEYYDDLDFQIEHHPFTQVTPFTTLPEDLLDESWRKMKGENAFEFLKRLNEQIHHEFFYIPDVTDVYHSASDAFTIRKGVCQDFAHVFISLARMNKIPCRYVSGYLNQGQEFKGNLQMHAWVEAFVPRGGWIGFDPTNNVLREENYIKVSHGTDYSECGSIRGILKAAGEQKTKYAVKVIQQ